MWRKFLSRKFLIGAASFIALMLASSGVIDPAREAELATALGAALYILVEGATDFIRVRGEKLERP